MKCSIINLTLALFFFSLFISFSAVTSTNVSTLKLKATHPNFNEVEARHLTEFAKFANCGSKPLTLTCKKCIHPDNGFKMFFFYQYTRLKKFNYKVFIHYSDSLKQVVISFGAPSVDHHKYVRTIYSRGFSLIKTYKVKIEKEFALIYFKKIRKVLIAKLNKLKHSGRAGYKFMFTGFSLGGSLAILSAYDLTNAKFLKKEVNHTTVYTYGALRIGDERFVALINQILTVWKIVRQDDYMVRIPNCYFSSGAWRCFTKPAIRKFIVTRRFPLTMYVRNYLSRGPLGKLAMYRQNMNLHAGHLAAPRFAEIKSRIKQHVQNRKWVLPRMVPQGALSSSSYKYVYYTQPLGTEICYNPTMTKFRSCLYVRGVSDCEKVISIPTTFTSLAHKTYFGVNFEQC